ncbi:helix-turn-helix transcriptional regulator [Robertmurraya sp. DFI.2.37]|uniref:helix-turn-helix transcriptional regulator n=1 Tax=Robertmurraya sp. DFI.2.37 TaxID=3031819 RepID=UPI0012485424|nr:helix-turn-helix transcriptional regulator [Robertmurraya sp. DFI.2.37]MDF1510694.1 helix-turn-helix transcriptional regulator [Robertmurraya sp. DFI.2.37]
MFVTYKVGRCRIQELLDDRGLTQQDLADKTGMSKQYINDKIHNRKGKHGMWIDSAKTIAAALGCAIDDLYEWIPAEKEAKGKSERK